MAKVIPDRVAAKLDGDFVVFLIGMRINAWWKPHKWLPVMLAMPRMIKELYADKGSGFLGHKAAGIGLMVQYWRSFEQLEQYARAKQREHWPAWIDFNRRVGRSRGDVGIWHETYLVRDGQYEAVYSGMPPIGLGAAGELVSASGNRDSARGRLQGSGG